MIFYGHPIFYSPSLNENNKNTVDPNSYWVLFLLAGFVPAILKYKGNRRKIYVSSVVVMGGGNICR